MARILIVDDEPVNRELIAAYLEGGPYELITAATGAQALDAAKQLAPDLVLLDVMLPDMSGYEVAPRLKQLAGDQYLPVVLLTALADQRSRTLGLQAGADEFVSKPVDRHELIARINTLLALRAKEQVLLERNIELVELQRFREELTDLIVHDLANPMSAILANYQFLTKRLGDVDVTLREALDDSHTAAKRVMRLLTNLVDVSKIEARRLELLRVPIRPGAMLSEVAAQRRMLTSARRITLDSEVDDQVEIEADPDIVTRVMENIIDNALRHTPSGGHIFLRCGPSGVGAQIEIGNSGPPVPDDARQLIFEKFGQRSSANGRMNLGLGLYFCRLAVESHGGRIWVDETPLLPTVFRVELPARAPAA